MQPLFAAKPTVARHGMVAGPERLAAMIGVDILKAGGNAVDAAVAVAFALAVTQPDAGNIGGGGFMLVHLAARNETIAIDYRETAPQAITRDSFLDAKGEADAEKSRNSGLAVGVPGAVAGLALALERYGTGKFTLAQLIAPAITLARQGITIEGDVANTLPRAVDRLGRWPSSKKIFFKPDGSMLARGETLMQPELAETLALIAQNGPRAFYEGRVAEKLVATVRAAGGVMTLDDLRNYRPVVRAPVRGSYRGFEIASMSPPSSGGVHIIQMLNLLEAYPLGALKAGSAETLHLMIEAMKLAYADRATFLGDPDFVNVPVEQLISKAYAEQRRTGIDPLRARPAAEIRAGNPTPAEGKHTGHFSIVDQFGNAVANTYTLNFNYGLGLVVDGAGFLLNNELDDFAAKPGVPNAFGLLGGDANAPGPGKRPLSSMSPTIVFKNGKPFLVTGSPGGSRIITVVLQVILNAIDHEMPIAEAVAMPRIHHQWSPDEATIEAGFAPEVIRALEARGHKIKPSEPAGAAHSILATPEGLFGGPDERRADATAAGH
ncbi:MAG TPA: gamma-glutamyltransferase [Pseudolabrys sp.]|nr:gamma-glutamyltransferase [Pseudolabrys sp.]